MSTIDKLKDTKSQSSGFSDYFPAAMKLNSGSKVSKFCNRAPVIVCFTLIQISAPVFEVVAGTITLKLCPRQPYLPLYALIAGASCIVMPIYGAVITFIERRNVPDNTYAVEQNLVDRSVQEEHPPGVCLSLAKLFQLIIVLFAISWFVCGNVWIFSMKRCTEQQLLSNFTADCFTSDLAYTDDSFYCHDFIHDVVYNGMFIKWGIVAVATLLACLMCCPPCCVYCCS